MSTASITQVVRYGGNMLGRLYERENCSAARALELVGERWSLLIIRNAAFAGMTRFTEFEQSLGIAPNILTSRLGDFVAAGLMEVVGPPVGAKGRRYVLTRKGEELAQVVMALTSWGDRWLAPEGPPVVYRHQICGGTIETRTECSVCGEQPAATETDATPGPGATPEQRTRLELRLHS